MKPSHMPVLEPHLRRAAARLRRDGEKVAAYLAKQPKPLSCGDYQILTDHNGRVIGAVSLAVTCCELVHHGFIYAETAKPKPRQWSPSWPVQPLSYSGV